MGKDLGPVQRVWQGVGGSVLSVQPSWPAAFLAGLGLCVASETVSRVLEDERNTPPPPKHREKPELPWHGGELGA